MKIQQMFKDDIDRKINGVVKVDQDANDVLVQELNEYVITKELKKHFISFFNNYGDAFNDKTADIGVWISGFFGSGKSHFLKILSYILENKEVDFVINYQDLQGIGMTSFLGLPTLIALCSIALGKPVLSSMTVLGDMSIAGTLIKPENLADTLQVCIDSGAKKILLPIISAADMGTVPPELMGAFNIIFYSSAEDAVFKALGVE